MRIKYENTANFSVPVTEGLPVVRMKYQTLCNTCHVPDSQHHLSRGFPLGTLEGLSAEAGIGDVCQEMVLFDKLLGTWIPANGRTEE